VKLSFCFLKHRATNTYTEICAEFQASLTSLDKENGQLLQPNALVSRKESPVHEAMFAPEKDSTLWRRETSIDPVRSRVLTSGSSSVQSKSSVLHLRYLTPRYQQLLILQPSFYIILQQFHARHMLIAYFRRTHSL
jgi:hypothetical protein